MLAYKAGCVGSKHNPPACGNKSLFPACFQQLSRPYLSAWVEVLQMHLLQHWFNLSDPAAEEALYESLSMRRFVGVDLGREPVPDETTILNFCRLLEQHELGKPLFERINQHLAARGMKVAGGTIVDATIIAAPSSTKNQAKAREPEMHQTRKGQQWYFGMKLHIGVDSKLPLIHSMGTTAANAHDGKMLGGLLHGNETRVYGDQAYRLRGLARLGDRVMVLVSESAIRTHGFLRVSAMRLAYAENGCHMYAPAGC
jgi:IS5 family transposase